MNIGTKIKELRREQDVTQEKLADYLNVSHQAISRWENGTAYPDITIVPALANFFGVSADELLGVEVNEISKEEDNEYAEEWFKLANAGKSEELIELCRSILGKYPKNYYWMTMLAGALSRQRPKDEVTRKEIISIYERVLKDCTDDALRLDAKSSLVGEYSAIGEKELAKKTLRELPLIYNTRELAYVDALEGEERIAMMKSNILIFVRFCHQALGVISSTDKSLSVEEKCDLRRASLQMFDIIFGSEENAFFYNYYYFLSYKAIAKIYCEDNQLDKSIEYLLLAESSAERYEKFVAGGVQYHSNLILKGLEDNPQNITRNSNANQFFVLLEEIQSNKTFEKLRDCPDFIALMERLGKH
ncbi:MAG: helix-turn-helix domain-containing protein [Oscillospiraceae bacterium]|nr:helix-turn-helix domain-containing protein [Oscillospiraceae bacterium]